MTDYLLSISIHALREEGDVSLKVPRLLSSNFYPRPPRGGRLGPIPDAHAFRDISIHALREEGDNKGFFKNIILIISIHALREEGDSA